MKVKIKKLKDVKTPTYGPHGSAGMDFYLPGEYSITLQPGLNKIDLGIAMEVPEGYVLTLQGKSGVSLKHELLILGGIIDHGYTGEISLICFYPKAETAKVMGGSKIVQGLLLPMSQATFEVVNELAETERGEAGFGSTGE